jgi:transposase
MQGNELKRFAVAVGLDWADGKHDILERDCATGAESYYKVQNTPEAVSKWLSELESRRSGGLVGVCMEACPGFLQPMLAASGFVELYALNPSMASKYRSAFFPSGAKDDPTDAALLLEMLLSHRDKLRMIRRGGDTFAALGELVASRRSLVDERTRLVQKLQAELKSYYPQALALCGELDSGMACDFIVKWPSVHALAKAKPHVLRKFYYAHNSRSETLVAARIESATAAVSALPDGELCAAHALMAASLAKQIDSLGAHIRKFDAKIDSLFDTCPDAEVFKSFPGAGAALAPRLMVAMGEEKEAYDNAGEVQNQAGVSPVTIRSGKSSKVCHRHQCSKFLKQTFHEFAGHSIVYSSWARAYYKSQMAKGCAHHAAVRSLAFKWIRIIFRCWKTGCPYDEKIYVQSLIDKGTALGLELKAKAA